MNNNTDTPENDDSNGKRMLEHEHSGEENASDSPPQSWVNALLDSEDYVREVLDEVRRLQIAGEGMKAHKLLVGMGSNQKNKKVFYGVYYSIMAFDFFMEDVEEEMGEVVLESVEEFSEDYQELKRDLVVAFAVNEYGYENPITDHNYTVEVKSENFVVSGFEGYTGKGLNLSVKDMPSNIMSISAMILDSVANGFREIEDEDRQMESILSIDEIEGQLDHIEDHIDEIREMVNEYKDNGDSDGA